MAVKMISVKCPECGANLSVEAGRPFLFCSYCGTKVAVSSDMPYSEVVFKTVDEASIRESENNKILKLKKLEMLEKQRASKEKRRERSTALKIAFSVILGPIAAGLFIYGAVIVKYNYYALLGGLLICLILIGAWFGAFGGDDDDDEKDAKVEDEVDFDDRSKVPDGLSYYADKDYKTVETILKGAGFSNVQSVPLNDLAKGLLLSRLFYKPGSVDSITIYGQQIDCNKKYLRDVPILISYHSFPDGRR